MITDRDIALRVVAAGRDPRSTTAGEVATKPVSVAYPDEPLDEALEQMAYQQVRRLPVIEDDRVIGILAQADIAEHADATQPTHALPTVFGVASFRQVVNGELFAGRACGPLPSARPSASSSTRSGVPRDSSLRRARLSD